MYKSIILSRKSLLQYLKLREIPHDRRGKVINLKCPFCKMKDFSANIIPNNHIIKCLNPKCSKTYTILDIAKVVESNFPKDEETQFQYIKEILDLKITTQKDDEDMETYLDFYVKNNFDLVPIAHDKKVPVEKDWTNKQHKDKDEWLRWIKKNSLNVGVKTGKQSNVTIIDIDQKPIPEAIKKVMGKTLMQESTKGYHLFYKYEKDLPKTGIAEYKIDIENDGGQVVIYPSIVKGIQRKISISEISTMPKELKTLLQKKITTPTKTNSEMIREDIKNEDFKIDPKDLQLVNNNLEGSCNSSFVKLGGILRKQLNMNQTGYVLHTLNKHLLDKPMESKAISSMLRELDKYVVFDEKVLAKKVYVYLKDIEEANRQEIAMSLMGTNRGPEKERVDKALTYLTKEGLVIKRGSRYTVIKKAEWNDTLIQIGNPIDFKVPYFYDMGYFNYGDMILIGSKNKSGKTHIAMNIVKQLVDQGIKPYYISLETGSRFAKIALQLGLKEGDVNWTFCSDPTKIELEPDSVTIIDWLLVIDKSKTDLIFRYFIEQLYKTNGFLIVFQQLKEDNGYFAPNMAKQFPCLATRYIYDNEGDGEYGQFKIDCIREPKMRIKSYEIPCIYDWNTKELKRVDEIQTGE